MKLRCQAPGSGHTGKIHIWNRQRAINPETFREDRAGIGNETIRDISRRRSKLSNIGYTGFVVFYSIRARDLRGQFAGGSHLPAGAFQKLDDVIRKCARFLEIGGFHGFLAFVWLRGTTGSFCNIPVDLVRPSWTDFGVP